MEKLNELFAIPQDASPRATIGNTTLYGSAILDSKFISAMSETSIVQPVWKDISKLVRRKTVLPCYLTKGYFSFFINKIFSPHRESDTLGMFSPNTKKIYILVDNWSNMFGAAPDSSLARTLMHELIHLFAYTKHSEFLSMFKKDLLNFYSNFFQLYFETKNEPNIKDIEKIFKILYFDFEVTTSESINLKKCRETMTKIFSNNTKFDKETFERKITYYFVAVKLLVTDFSALRSYYSNALVDIPRCLYRAYTNTLKIKPNGTMIVQELMYPSEVICLLASHGSKGDLQKVYSAIGKI